MSENARGRVCGGALRSHHEEHRRHRVGVAEGVEVGRRDRAERGAADDERHRQHRLARVELALDQPARRELEDGRARLEHQRRRHVDPLQPGVAEADRDREARRAADDLAPQPHHRVVGERAVAPPVDAEHHDDRHAAGHLLHHREQHRQRQPAVGEQPLEVDREQQVEPEPQHHGAEHPPPDPQPHLLGAGRAGGRRRLGDVGARVAHRDRQVGRARRRRRHMRRDRLGAYHFACGERRREHEPPERELAR